MQIQLNEHIIKLEPNVNLSQYRSFYNGAEWWINIVNFLEQWANSSDTILLKTSGSTGKPKTIAVEKRKMWISATKTCHFFQLNTDSKGLLCLSANYIAGQMMLVRTMVAQMKLICVEPSSNPIKDLAPEIDFAAMVPMQVQQCIEDGSNINSIKNLIIGGGAVSSQLAKLLQQTGVTAYETFGMTESLSHIALKKVSPLSDDYFTPLNGVQILKDEDNQLIISCDDLGIDGLRTNDIIELKPEGKFKWKGRTDFVINTGGVKISPEELEYLIEPLLASYKYIISSVPDTKLGEKVVLIIEGKPFDTLLLLQKIKNSLSSYSAPKEILFIEKFPLTISGKIKRKEIQTKIKKPTF